MPLTVLSDGDIQSLLYSFEKVDIQQLQNNLCEVLHDYSTGTQETTQGCSSNQPKRLMMPAPDNQTTLVMPASTSTSRGIKTVTLSTPFICPNAPAMSRLDLNRSNSEDGSPTSMGHPFHANVGSQSSSTPSRASSISNQGPMLSKTSSTASSERTTGSARTESGISASTVPTSINSSSAASIHSTNSNGKYEQPVATAANPRGSLTLMTASGLPYAFLAAEELTAFRTALASTVLLCKRIHVHSIVVLGAGLQARWHIRLALLLRAGEIHHVDIINRSFRRAKSIMYDFHNSPDWQRIRELNPKVQFSIVSTEFKEYAQHAKDHIRKADAIFCCTPSTTPLFAPEVLTNTDGRKKGRYISAIGSFRPHMCELPPELLCQAVANGRGHHTSNDTTKKDEKQQHHHHHHHHPHLISNHQKHAEEGGVILVDSLESALKESGEIIQAGITPDQLVEVGELLMIRKTSMREIEMGIGPGEKGLREWLEKGNVIYKSVGLGCMDICVGEDLVIRANEAGVGKVIEGF